MAQGEMHEVHCARVAIPSLLPDSEKDGFVFGVIASSRTDAPASWGDAYVVGPDGTRAGIVWRMKGPVTEVVFLPEPGR